MSRMKFINPTTLAILTLMSSFATPHFAYALGMGDLMSVGIDVGSKVVGSAVGAGVDKVKDAMRDPEAEAAKKKAEEQKLLEKYQQAIAEIENRGELSPLQREKGVLGVKKNFAKIQQLEQMAKAAEASQRAERDQIFTASGMLGAVGNAAMNTPSMVMAQADSMSKSPSMRAQVNSTMQQADAAYAGGANQAKVQSVMNAVAIASKVDFKGLFKGSESPNQKDASLGNQATGLPRNPDPFSELRLDEINAFAPDLGKKIYLEFVGSQRLTQAIRATLQTSGHSITDTRADAEVIYLMEGEYAVAESKEYKGISLNAAELLDDPQKTIELPSTNTSGLFKAGLGKLVSAVGQAQGMNLPKTTASGYRQQVLMVAARQPKGGAETRVATLKESESPALEGVSLTKRASDEWFARMGLLSGNPTTNPTP